MFLKPTLMKSSAAAFLLVVAAAAKGQTAGLPDAPSQVRKLNLSNSFSIFSCPQNKAVVHIDFTPPLKFSPPRQAAFRFDHGQLILGDVVALGKTSRLFSQHEAGNNGYGIRIKLP